MMRDAVTHKADKLAGSNPAHSPRNHAQMPRPTLLIAHPSEAASSGNSASKNRSGERGHPNEG